MTAEQRLDRLESIESAREALARYADACDAQDLDAVCDLFTGDAVLEVPGHLYTGGDQVRHFYREAWQEDPSQKSHFITNVKTRWLGTGRVEVDSYFLYTAAGDASSVLGWGVYRDTVRTTDGVGRFEQKSIAIRRAVDVRQGWARSPELAAPGDGPPA